MHKMVLGLTLIATTLISTIAFGQTFFGGGGAKTTTSTTTTQKGPPGAAAHPNPVIAPDNFGSLVNSLDQQTKSTLNNEYKQQLSKQPPMPNITQPPIQNIPSEVVPATGNAPTNMQMMQPPPGGPTEEMNEGPPPPSTVSSELPPPPPVAQPNQPQVYTGFGTGNQNQPGTAPANPPPGNQSGGWNIKY